MSEIRVLGVLVSEKSQAAITVQEVLTKYGCNIRTRLGLNELDREQCAGCGLIILELMGDLNESLRLENDLWSIPGVKVQKMIF